MKEKSNVFLSAVRVRGYEEAGGRNRTDVFSLEGWGFTTKLHPRYF
jgi:hypothetical protein